MPKATTEEQTSSQSPLTWIIMAIIALIMVLVFFSDRSGKTTEQISLDSNQSKPSFAGEIERPSLAPPGLAAREFIRQAREKGQPYPLTELHDKAIDFQRQQNMADAHLLFFFCAREGHLASILKMAEMADPLLFDGQYSLLDDADPVQAYKWYRIALQRDNAEAQKKIEDLEQWARAEINIDNKAAQQLLLNFPQSNENQPTMDAIVSSADE